MAYTLRKGIYCCVANGRVALLDVVADKYFCLPPLLDAAFQAMMKGEVLDSDQCASLAKLAEKDILVPTVGSTTPLCLTQAWRPETSVIEAALSQRTLPSPPAFTAIVLATNRFRRESLDVILTRIAKRKVEAPQVGRALPYDWLASFLQMRRLVSSRDQCLRQSVALVDFLAQRSFFPTLVLGVRMKPFEAHAWVQHEAVILNETLDQVRRYTPILAI